ncbi:MAG: sulfotransferase [Planctomycetota bacterium]|nr:MAG: sulfotransferase [Planctomycetota bacterium]
MQDPHTADIPHGAAESERPVRVLYIMGAGRSGSTLLDAVLASHPDAFGSGELANLHRNGWSSNEVCSCGQLGSECDFWTRVRSAWHRRVPTATVNGFVELQKRFEIPNWSGLFQCVRQWLSRTEDFQSYLRQTEALYQAIAEVSGRSVVIDSSKTPMRGALLARMRGLDVRWVHLVRDARAVAWSRQKSFAVDQNAGVQKRIKPRPTWYSVSYWAYINLLSSLVCLFHRKRSVRLRYEDVVTEPQQTLAQVSDLCGLDYSSTVAALLRGDPIRVEHAIAGNRMRMNGSIRIKPDWEWRDRLPVREQAICWLCAGWLLLAYGYARLRRTPESAEVASPSTNATRAA